MINSTELRIGNWILVAGTGEVHPAKVNINNLRQLVQHGGEYASPIPLTPEILEKAGFEKREVTEDGVIYGKTKYTLIYAVATDGLQHFFLNGYHNDVQIDYLHHIQNIYLDFTGNELEIDL